MHSLNVGLLAHVDAGKTSLTERLLFESGAIRAQGSVDSGTTQTDSLTIERERGITVRAAVTSFTSNNTIINLVDTPGHADFIAEVERVLGVLDVAVLVVSAVEGIQPQTRILMRALQKTGTPTVVCINKIDRANARPNEVAMEVRDQFSGVHTIHYTSAITGVGVAELVQTLVAYARRQKRDAQAPLSAVVFKIEHTPKGERQAYLRLYGGTLTVRTPVDVVHRAADGIESTSVEKITSMKQSRNARWVSVRSAHAGDIVVVSGLAHVAVNDWIGTRVGVKDAHFEQPSFRTVVSARGTTETVQLYKALTQIAEQDPHVHVSRGEDGALSVLLYGEVQREVLKDTLVQEYKLDVQLSEPRVIHIEKVRGVGSAFADRHDPNNHCEATIGLEVRPGYAGSGVVFNIGVGRGLIPVAFQKAIEDTVHAELRRGLYGWGVTDCAVTVTAAGYDSVISDGGDFRTLTTLLLKEALVQAKTDVYEPLNSFEVIVPERVLTQVLQMLAGEEARINRAPIVAGAVATVVGTVPVRTTYTLKRKLLHITGGEGICSVEQCGHQKVRGKVPVNEQ